MKKLFISPLIDGKTDEEFLKERKNAIKSAEKILKEPVEVIDLVFRAGLMLLINLFGLYRNRSNCYQLLTLRIFRKVGKARERAGLSTPALSSTGLQ